MMLCKESVAAVILAGGAGRRMSGADKGLEVYQGRRLVERVYARVSPQVASTIVCANRNICTYQSLGYNIVADHEPDKFNGPLAGVVAAIGQYQSASAIKALLVCPCDTPHLPLNLLTRLMQVLGNAEDSATDSKCAVVHDGERQHSLHFLLLRSSWSSLCEFVDEGGRAAQRWHKKAGSIEVDFSDQAGQFRNINYPEELLL